MENPTAAASSGRQYTAGAALVLVLLAIFTLSSLVILFFSLAASDRSNSNAYAQGLKVDELAAGGLELVIGKLREEIVDASRSTETLSVLGNGPAVYVPKEARYILPDNTVSGTSAPRSTLIKISKTGLSLSYLASGTSLASNASSATPSRNGRVMSQERWNKPVLTDFSGSSAITPDWIYLNRKGPVVDPAIADARSESSESLVTGRIAFAVYDIAGLLDANVAGYPQSVPDSDAGKKGSPAFARLDALSMTQDASTALLEFRNRSTGATAVKFLNHLSSPQAHEGFTRTIPGDNRFLSRQELIRFAKNNGFSDQLPLLTVFSREKNAPSVTPDVPSPTNPDLSTARHAGTGRLLFETRFPLNKLSLLAAAQADPDDTEVITELRTWFGLKYDDSDKTFTYTAQGNSAANSIKSLEEIAAESAYRAPDFFETLKAAIDAGSLGGSAGSGAADAPEDSGQERPDSQILQVGANIADQFDADDLPTTITNDWSDVPVWGVESLPYVNKLMFLGERDSGNATVGSNNPQGAGDNGFRIGVELWNPHLQQLPTHTGRQFRIRLGPASATTRVDIFKDFHAEDESSRIDGDPATVGGYAVIFNETDNTMHSTADWDDYRYFTEPSVVRMGKANANLITTTERYWSALCVASGLYVELAVFDGTDYRTYQRTYPIDGYLLYTKENAPANSASTLRGASAFVRSDPRTNRGGTFPANFRPASNTIPAYPASAAPNGRAPWSLRRDAFTNGPGTTDHDPTSGYSAAGAPFYLGWLYENTSPVTQMRDPDGKFRTGDGGFVSGGPIPTQPVFNFSGFTPIGPNPSRPIILNRPFRNVAELGYAFRDTPWKTLNFSGTDSADASLLDVFSMDDQPVHAGKININSSNEKTLVSLLQGSLRIEGEDSSALSESQAAELAAAITGSTQPGGGTPLKNVANFVRDLSRPDILTPSAFGSSDSQAIKMQREAVIRALSGSTQSRTWNVLIDLVAQTGKFPVNAGSLDDFIVEGERRIWLHLAVDRYTGEILDEQLELVQE